MTDLFTNCQLIAGLAVIGYVAALGLTLKWIERHTATLADDDPRVFCDGSVEGATCLETKIGGKP